MYISMNCVECWDSQKVFIELVSDLNENESVVLISIVTVGWKMLFPLQQQKRSNVMKLAQAFETASAYKEQHIDT